MQLSQGEKLIIAMLGEIYDHLKIKGEIDHKFVLESIYSGQTWSIEWQYPGLFGAEDPPKQQVTETCDVLDMWNILETSYEKLTKEDKDRVASEAEIFGKNPRFRGFDGNNERHYGIARHLVDNLGRFEYFKGRELNSHSPSIELYRRMLEVFEQGRPLLGDRRMSANEIIEVLNAAIHPTQR